MIPAKVFIYSLQYQGFQLVHPPGGYRNYFFMVKNICVYG